VLSLFANTENIGSSRKVWAKYLRSGDGYHKISAYLLLISITIEPTAELVDQNRYELINEYSEE
jgi:hypothetical protein